MACHPWYCFLPFSSLSFFFGKCWPGWQRKVEHCKIWEMVSAVDLIAAKSRLLLRQGLCRIRIQSVPLEGHHTTSYPTVPCTGAHTSAICRCLASTHFCPRTYHTFACTGAHTSAICRCLASTHVCPRTYHTFAHTRLCCLQALCCRVHQGRCTAVRAGTGRSE